MPIEQMTDTFVQEWFDLLSEHAPVADLLRFISAGDLVMEFPERTLLSHADVADWYATVGRTYTTQDHVVERVDSTPTASGTTLDVTVVWTATLRDDGRELGVRVNQRWELVDSPSGRPVIVGYHVLDMSDL